MQKPALKHVLLLISVIVLILMSACGSSGNGGSESGGNSGAGNTATQKPEDNSTDGKEDKGSDEKKPSYGGEVVMVVPQDPDYLDPHMSAASGTLEMMFNVFEGLLKSNEKGELQPAVASSYDISEDGLTYTFKLREGVKFHNGNDVTAEDVQYSIERLMGKDTGQPLKTAFDNVESVTIIDAHTVELKLKQNDVSFLSFMTNAILPAGYDKHNEAPIGTGPFKFVEYSPNQRVVIAKNEDYYVEGVPYLDKVEFRIMPDGESSLLALKAGDVDIYPRIGDERIAELGDEFRYVDGMQNMVQLMTMNIARKPFDDVKVRQAINYAVDVDSIIELIANGKGTKLGSNMSPVMDKYFQEDLENTYNVNIEKAKELLKEAGYEDGFTTTISVPSNYKFHVDTAQVIADQLSQVGIKAEIEMVEWAVWLERIYKGRDYDMTIIGLTGKLDPHEVLVRYVSDYKANFYNYVNPAYDKLINDAKVELDDSKRVELYKEAQKILTQDAVAVYIMDPNFTIAMDKALDGYKLYPLYVQDMSSIHYLK
ncbi:ABC transporter substrate-binding protein [Paenibacillus sp. J5C2022]|uniref:ABC transporter substrate-binding protein n=1 Tax=Paenibacillus sp. J5C2022 TaxID=2977129 RepID=UPI0021D2CD35|nr:ABC transporter substrate-binding protein [Paenibacillus sp. J5C2022]